MTNLTLVVIKHVQSRLELARERNMADTYIKTLEEKIERLQAEYDEVYGHQDGES